MRLCLSAFGRKSICWFRIDRFSIAIGTRWLVRSGSRIGRYFHLIKLMWTREVCFVRHAVLLESAKTVFIFAIMGVCRSHQEHSCYGAETNGGGDTVCQSVWCVHLKSVRQRIVCVFFFSSYQLPPSPSYPLWCLRIFAYPSSDKYVIFSSQRAYILRPYYSVV